MVEGYEISSDRSRIDIDAVHAMLIRSHWAKYRTRETVAKSVANSLCYGIYKGKKQVAVARVVTDYSTFAYLCDVFVDEDHRGRGLSKWMMAEIMARADLKGLRRFVLATKDAHTLYKRFGFNPFTTEEVRRFMSILDES